MIDLRPAAWMVTDDRGYESLHRTQALAEDYLHRVRGGIIEPLVRRSQVVTVLSDLGPDLGPDSQGADI